MNLPAISLSMVLPYHVCGVPVFFDPIDNPIKVPTDLRSVWEWSSLHPHRPWVPVREPPFSVLLTHSPWFGNTFVTTIIPKWLEGSILERVNWKEIQGWSCWHLRFEVDWGFLKSYPMPQPLLQSLWLKIFSYQSYRRKLSLRLRGTTPARPPLLMPPCLEPY